MIGLAGAKFWPPCGGWGGMYGGLGCWPSPSKRSLKIFDETSLAFCVRNVPLGSVRAGDVSGDPIRLRIISQSIVNVPRNRKIQAFVSRSHRRYLNSSLKSKASKNRRVTNNRSGSGRLMPPQTARRFRGGAQYKTNIRRFRLEIPCQPDFVHGSTVEPSSSIRLAPRIGRELENVLESHFEIIL
jgi:hypothetical protein